MIKKKDRKGIEDLLTNKQVEEKLLQRLKRKADVYGREIDDQSHVIEIDEKIRLPINAVVSYKYTILIYFQRSACTRIISFL